MSKTITIDELMDEKPVAKAKRPRISSKPKVQKVEDIDNGEDEDYERKFLETEEQIKKSAEKEIKARTGGDRLLRDANNVLEVRLKRTPQYKVLSKQIEILKEERLNYKKIGDEANQLKCELLIKDVTEKMTGFRKIFKGTNQSSEDKKKLNEKISNSEEIKELNKERKELKKKVDMTKPMWWVNRMKNYRDQIELRDNLSEYYPEDSEVEDLSDEEIENLGIKIDNEIVTVEENEEMIEQLTKESDQDLMTEYESLCGTITRMINNWINENPDFIEAQEKLIEEKLADGKKASRNNLLHKVSIQEIIDIPLNKLRTYLNIVLNKDRKALQEKLDEVNVKLSLERSKLSGKNEITDILFEIFDYNEEEEVPKEILVASKIPLIKKIAYNFCSKYGMLEELDDAISYGLLGLTNVVNKWYTSQKMLNSALSIDGLISIEVPFTIQKGLLELTGGGVISGTNKATLFSKVNKKQKDFIKYNPEFKNLDKDFLNEILAGYDTDTNIVVNSASEITSNVGVGSDEEQDADIWANMNADKSSDISEELDGRIQYQALLDSLKKIFSLFDYREKDGEFIQKNNRKMFDKYDRRIFMMYFGFETKSYADKDINKRTGVVRNTYTLKEIAEEVQSMMRADGYIDKTFTIGALTDSRPGHEGRLTRIIMKLKGLAKTNPEIYQGLAYIYKYYQEHKGVMDKLSDSREELVTKIDRDELREIYADIPQKLNQTMADGTKLSDIVEVSENNPLDEESVDVFFMDFEDEPFSDND